jgi:hypothetical protein
MSRAIRIFCSYSLSSLPHKILPKYITRGLANVVCRDEVLPRYDNTLTANWLPANRNRVLHPFQGGRRRVLKYPNFKHVR